MRESATPESLRRRASKLEICLKELQPEIAMALAPIPEAEWVFGRLLLLGLITQEQYDAALRIDNLLRQYRSLLAPHGKIKGWRPEALRGAASEDLSPSAQKKMLEVRKEYERVYGILKRCGPDVVSSLFTMLEMDIIGDLKHVYRGLNAVLIGE